MQRIKKKKVFVAMSGGVDSSVAALLLKKQGYEVTGVFMRCYNLDGCFERDAADARRVAHHLDIPFYVWDFEKEYKKRVVEYMISGYKSGITPNPDVMCNKQIKFGLFLEKALALGADYIATGHYVRLRRTITDNKQLTINKNKKNSSQMLNVKCQMFTAKDGNKDQSYFLWILTQEQLKYCLFPIGDYLKGEVREIARKAGLPTAEKKDSQGICFLGKISLADFLKNYIPEERGAVLTTAGEKIGEHSGVWYHTIGQRHIAIANRRGQLANSKPLYVVEKNVETNTLVVAEGDKNPVFSKKEIELRDVNFINPQLEIPMLARVRYRQPLTNAKLYKPSSRARAEGLEANSYKLVPNESIKFVAPGQSAVFYSKQGELIGGGIIL